LVALAHVVVVVQAGLRSGARNAAAQARRLGRPLLVVPSAPWVGRGLGCLAELKQGARLCEGPKDVLTALSELGCTPIALPRWRSGSLHKVQPASPSVGASAALEPAPPILELTNNYADSDPLERVLTLIRDGAQHADQLGAQAGLSASETQRVLLTLRLRGVLACDPTGRLVLRNQLD
jgi:DNA processing protein